MLLSIICIDLSVPWFPAKSLKSDFSQSLAFKTLTIEKDIYPSYFKKKLSGREEEGLGGVAQKPISLTNSHSSSKETSNYFLWGFLRSQIHAIRRRKKD